MQGRDRDRGAAGRAKNLGRLKILHEDRLLERDMADLCSAQEREHGPMDFTERKRHRLLRGHPHRRAAQQHRRPAGNSINANPVPRNEGSMPSTRPTNADRCCETGGTTLEGTERPSSFAFHISRTFIRAMHGICRVTPRNTRKICIGRSSRNGLGIF